MANGFWERFSPLRQIASIRIRAERTGLMNDLRPIENVRKQRGNPLIDRAGAARTTGDIDNRKIVAEPKDRVVEIAPTLPLNGLGRVC